MKIDYLGIKKWWHWLVAVIILALLIFLALLLAQGIICWACKTSQNIAISDNATSPNYLADNSTEQSDNQTRVFAIFDLPYPPTDGIIDFPDGIIKIDIPSDNCSWGN